MIAGVDIGGTFTDFVFIHNGHIQISKTFSTPDDPARAMLAGLTAHAQEQIEAVVHGSTVATNAILERKGAKIALLTTQGFSDILAIGRQNRPVLYALQPTIPPLLIPPERCFDVAERLDHTGAVIKPLDVAALDAVLDQLAAQEIEAVAVCLLYSYVNPAHEQAVRARILERGLLGGDGARVALSCEVLPEFREYERASTIALEAYVRPVMSRYLQRLERYLPAPLRIMKSDGGVASARRASVQAIHTALSGPAAGVIGAFHVASAAGYDQIITLDIGGTSTDVSLCPGAPVRYPEREIDGLPLRIPTLDIETIGAGGGSIVRLDVGGALRVGPESAGADPGAIIYGRGGSRITVSDAHAVLGRLDAEHFLGGGLTLDIPAAQAAMDTLGQQMGLDTKTAARGVLQIANVKIEQAIRRVSIARGYDPRTFTLVAFGGAGPLHGCEVAERLGIPRVLAPRYPGAMCALGLLMADVVIDYSRSVLGADVSEAVLQAHLNEMIAQARADLSHENVAGEAMHFNGSLDIRYRGQAYELTVPLGANFAEAFHAAHARRYGYAMPDRPLEVVNARLQAIGRVEKAQLVAEECIPNNGQNAVVGYKTMGRDQVSLYEREQLHPGAEMAGPALIFQLDSTVFIPAGWSARVDGYRNLLLEHNQLGTVV